MSEVWFALLFGLFTGVLWKCRNDVYSGEGACTRGD